MLFRKHGKTKLLYYWKGMGNHKHFKVVGFLYICEIQKSIETLSYGTSKFPNHKKYMRKHKKFPNSGFLKIPRVKQKPIQI